MSMLRFSFALLLAVTANAATNTGHFRSWYAYDVTVAGAHDIALRGMTCKNAYVNLLVLNSASSTSDGESLENTAKHFLSYEYPGSKTCTNNAYTAAGGITGNCPRRILKQDTITTTPIDMGNIVALTSDTDTTTQPWMVQIQFATDDMESCTNTAASSGDAHAGHNHRRSGSHATGTFTFEVSFPSTGRWFFYSDQDLASYEFAINAENQAAYTVAKKEVLTDPNACSATTTTTTCKCYCDTEKYMWAGIILIVGLLGLAPIIFKQMATSDNLAYIMSLFNCFGGGCLLAVAVSHVFPEALDLYPSTKSGDYPAAAILCAGGYWLILMVDKVLLSLCAPESAATEEETSDKPQGKSGEDPEHGDEPNPMIDMSSKSAQPQGHGAGIDDHDPTLGSVWHVMGVFLAMALHSILAGLAVGLKCDKTNMENLCIAIVCHKAFDVTTVGILLVRAQAPLLHSIPICAFVALMTPVGVLIGIGGEDLDVEVNGSLQAVAAGTFLYVAIQEVLASEFAKPGSAVVKGFSVFGGIGVIALASIANTNGGHTH